MSLPRRLNNPENRDAKWNASAWQEFHRTIQRKSLAFGFVLCLHAVSSKAESSTAVGLYGLSLIWARICSTFIGQVLSEQPNKHTHAQCHLQLHQQMIEWIMNRYENKKWINILSQNFPMTTYPLKKIYLNDSWFKLLIHDSFTSYGGPKGTC